MELAVTVNGTARAIEAGPHATLLEVLRDGLGLVGAKDGCSEGECGACTVLVDGEAVDSCITAAHAVAGSIVETVEAVGATPGLAPLQEALVGNAAVQCGFCTPGFVMSLTALLRENPAPSEQDVRTAVAGNLCRCTGYAQIVEAVVALGGSEAR